MAFFILATSWPANQGCFAIIKMGVFIQHFVHHLVCGQEEIGILDFMGLHYFNHEHHHFNPADYDNLPVQHHQPEQQNNVQCTPFWLIVLQQVGASPDTVLGSPKTGIPNGSYFAQPHSAGAVFAWLAGSSRKSGRFFCSATL